ncbi:MAG: BrnT family toxin [Actinobacteria bacterium]|nr:BrnT family toxin [Actinomycetota bacterium]
MRIDGFEWHEAIAEKIEEKHTVTTEEAEEVFDNDPKVYKRGDRYTALGRANNGHYLFVVFAYENWIVRFITVRDMTKSEQKRYRK